MAIQNFTNAYTRPRQDYYKLRAYDLGASSPSPQFWVSKTIDYVLAPPPPDGGPYGPITVVENWRA